MTKQEAGGSSPYTEPSNDSRRGEEVPVPWQFRINKFDKPVSVSTKTGTEKFNFWEIEGNELKYGYHGAKETIAGSSLGELTPMGPNMFLLEVNPDVKQSIVDELLPKVLEEMEKKGIAVQVMRGDQAMAA